MENIRRCKVCNEAFVKFKKREGSDIITITHGSFQVRSFREHILNDVTEIFDYVTDNYYERFRHDICLRGEEDE